MTYPSIEGSKDWYKPKQKELLDLLHFAKIEDSEAIFVLNKDNYIGYSTGREIIWARMRGKLVFWLESFPPVLHHPNDRTRQHLPGWAEYVAQYGAE
jgi:hypothetical protein